MCAVYNDARKNGLHAPLPFCAANAFYQSFFFQTMLLSQHAHGFQCQCRIHHLVSGNKWNEKLCFAINPGSRQKANSLRCVIQQLLPAFLHLIPGTAQFFRSGFYHLCRLFPVAVKNDRYSFFHNTRFLSCNFLNGVAQIFHMVQTDGCNHAGHGRKHGIGGIQPSAQSGFQNNVIHILLFKHNHSHQKQKFKIGGVIIPLLYQTVSQILYFRKCLCKSLV